MKLSTVLKEIADAFESAKRHDGTPYVRLKDDVPAWMKYDDHKGTFMLRVHAALDDRGPDDWVYEVAASMAGYLADNAAYHERKTDDPWEPYDAATEAADNEVEVYTHDLTKWLASNISNVSLVDEAVEEYGGIVGLFDSLMAGQALALRRIANALVDEAVMEHARRVPSEAA